METVPPASRARSWRGALLAIGALVLAAGWFGVHNFDIWLHARTGEWILEQGRVPDTNVMSVIHRDHPSVHDKWGFQVLTHLLFDGAGPLAVVVARVLVLAGLFGLLAATARRLGAGPWGTLAVLALAAVAMRTRFLFRPDLASLVLQALFLYLLLTGRVGVKRGLLLVALQVVWVNLHGYFLLGWMTVGAVGVGHLLRGRVGVGTGLRLLGLAAVLCAACLLNPSGWRGWWHPFAILTDLSQHADFYRSTIAEFRPTFAADPRQPYDRIAYLVLGGLTLALAAWDLARRRPRSVASDAPADDRWSVQRLPALAAVLLYGAMSFSLRRSMAPFAVAAAPVAAALLSARLGPRFPGSLPALALLALVAWGEQTDHFSVHDGLDRRAGSELSRLAYPFTGIAFIAEHLPTASVFTAFRYGSTFTGHRWPEQAASINGNTHGYPTSYFQDVQAAVSGSDAPRFEYLVRRHGHDVALLPLESPLAGRLLRGRDWTLVCVGVDEAVFVRGDAVDPAWLAEHDLERELVAGRVPGMPSSPPAGRWLGLPAATRPRTELAAAEMFAEGGYGRPALELARRALAHSPELPEALALTGLLELRHGDAAEGRRLLERSLEAGGYNPWREAARQALDEQQPSD